MLRFHWLRCHRKTTHFCKIARLRKTLQFHNTMRSRKMVQFPGVHQTIRVGNGTDVKTSIEATAIPAINLAVNQETIGELEEGAIRPNQIPRISAELAAMVGRRTDIKETRHLLFYVANSHQLATHHRFLNILQAHSGVYLLGHR